MKHLSMCMKVVHVSQHFELAILFTQFAQYVLFSVMFLYGFIIVKVHSAVLTQWMLRFTMTTHFILT